MKRSIEISDADQARLREILDITGLSQKALAKSARVTEPWLSQILTGRRRSISGEMFERIAKRLTQALKERRTANKLPVEQAENASTFLTRLTSPIEPPSASKIYRPGGPVPLDAAHYIKPDKFDEALQALQELPFTMKVTGPVQCGKSSLLARLEHKARQVGIETAWFDPQLLSGSHTDGVRTDYDITRESALGLAELLQTQWGLEKSSDWELDSLARLVQWLVKSLGAAPNRPRLLIIDDLAHLGPRAAEDWLSIFVRAIHNKRAMGGPQLSIAVGMNLQFGPYFERRLLEISSVVHWWPRIDLGWLPREKARSLERAVTAKAVAKSPDAFEFFGGQPYLTHAAAVDAHFHDAVRDWLNDPTEFNARPIQGAQPYKRHLNSIRFNVFGRSLARNTETDRLLEILEKACEKNPDPPPNSDYALFLRSAALIDNAGCLTLPLYRLITEDLRGLSKE